MKMGALTSFVHVGLAFFYTYSVYVYCFTLNPPEEIIKARANTYGPFKYLTFWDLLIQWLFFSLYSVSALCSRSSVSRSRRSGFQVFIDFTFATIVLPTSLFVTTSFWGIYSFNREMIFPVIFDSFFPSWLNHAVHTLPTIASLLELITTHHVFPSQRKGFLCVGFFALLYLAWVMHIAYSKNHWVYPILAHLNNVGRAGFIAAMCVLIGIFYIIGHMLQTLRWGKPEVQEQLIFHSKKRRD